MTTLADPAATVVGGSILLAAIIAFAAGIVSFLSPCVLPLVPAYLSYVAGMTGAEYAELARAGTGGPATGGSGSSVAAPPDVRSVALLRSRVVLGTVLFIAGFTAVFVSFGALFGGLGAWLVDYSDVITRVLGVVIIVMGLAFMGAIPALQREARITSRPSAGLAGAPVLGVVFGIGWTPCLGPTLGAVQTLAYSSATAGRGALLSLIYCLGLGLPFLVAAVAFTRAMGAVRWLRQHSVLIMRIGGGMLIALGLLLVTGAWDALSVDLRVWVSGFSTAL